MENKNWSDNITDPEAKEIAKLMGWDYNNDKDSEAHFDLSGLSDWVANLVNEGNKSVIPALDLLIKMDLQNGCFACNQSGMYHCAYPDECGRWDRLTQIEKIKNELNK